MSFTAKYNSFLWLLSRITLPFNHLLVFGTKKDKHQNIDLYFVCRSFYCAALSNIFCYFLVVKLNVGIASFIFNFLCFINDSFCSSIWATWVVISISSNCQITSSMGINCIRGIAKCPKYRVLALNVFKRHNSLFLLTNFPWKHEGVTGHIKICAASCYTTQCGNSIVSYNISSHGRCFWGEWVILESILKMDMPM